MPAGCTLQQQDPTFLQVGDSIDQVTEIGNSGVSRAQFAESLTNNTFADNATLINKDRDVVGKVTVKGVQVTGYNKTVRSALHNAPFTNVLKTQAFRMQTHPNPQVRALAVSLVGDLVKNGSRGSSMSQLFGTFKRIHSHDGVVLEGHIKAYVKSQGISVAGTLTPSGQAARRSFNKDVVESLLNPNAPRGAHTDGFIKSLKISVSKMVRDVDSMSGVTRNTDEVIDKHIQDLLSDAMANQQVSRVYARTQGVSMADVESGLAKIASRDVGLDGVNAATPMAEFGGKSLSDIVGYDLSDLFHNMVKLEGAEYASGAMGFVGDVSKRGSEKFRDAIDNFANKAKDVEANDIAILKSLAVELSGKPVYSELPNPVVSFVKQWMLAGWLGKAGMTAMSEWALYSGKYGVQKTFLQSVRSLPEAFFNPFSTKSVGMSKDPMMKELHAHGLLFEEDSAIFGTLAQIGDDVSNAVGEGAWGMVKSIGNKLPDIVAKSSGVENVTKWQRVANLHLFTKEILEGDLNGRALKSAGFSVDQAHKLRRNIQKAQANGKQLGIEDWDDRADVMRFLTAVEQNVTQDVYKVGIGDKAAAATGDANTNALLTFMSSMIGSFARQGTDIMWGSSGKEAAQYMMLYSIYGTMVTTGKFEFGQLGKSDVDKARARDFTYDGTRLGLFGYWAGSTAANFPGFTHLDLAHTVLIQPWYSTASPFDALPIAGFMTQQSGNASKIYDGLLSDGSFKDMGVGALSALPASSHPLMGVIKNMVGE